MSEAVKHGIEARHGGEMTTDIDRLAPRHDEGGQEMELTHHYQACPDCDGEGGQFEEVIYYDGNGVEWRVANMDDLQALVDEAVKHGIEARHGERSTIYRVYLDTDRGQLATRAAPFMRWQDAMSHMRSRIRRGRWSYVVRTIQVTSVVTAETKHTVHNGAFVPNGEDDEGP